MKHNCSSSKLLLAAIVLSLSGLLLGSFYIKGPENSPIRQLLHEPSPPSSLASTSSKTELVSFRALQPDGSLEIKHVVVDAVVRFDDSNNSIRAGAGVVVVKPRHNFRPSRKLQSTDDINDSNSSQDQGFYRKTFPMPAQQTASHRRLRRLDRQAYETSEGTGIGALSAVLVGIAAVVIGCAAVLLMMDVHDRIHYEKIVEYLRANHPEHPAIYNNTEEGWSGNLPLTEQRGEQAPLANISMAKNIQQKCQKESVAQADSKFASDASTSSSEANVYVEDSDPGTVSGTTFISTGSTLELSNEHLVLDLSVLSKLIHSAPLGTKKTDSRSTKSEDSITNSSLPGTAVEI